MESRQVHPDTEMGDVTSNSSKIDIHAAETPSKEDKRLKFILKGIRRKNQFSFGKYKPQTLYMYQDGGFWTWILFFTLVTATVFAICFCVYNCAFETYNKYIIDESLRPELLDRISNFINSEQLLGISILFSFAIVSLAFTND